MKKIKEGMEEELIEPETKKQRAEVERQEAGCEESVNADSENLPDDDTVVEQQNRTFLE